MTTLHESERRPAGTTAPIPAARVVFSEQDRAEIAERVDRALRTGNLTLGGNTREFEVEFAAYHEAPFAVAVSSGTAALEIILRSLSVAGKDVIVPANTFAATAFAVIAAGGRPVFADVDPDTFAIDRNTAEAVLTNETAAVVIVHIGGLISPGVDELSAWCGRLGIPLVEDAAHAHGSTYRGKHAGSFGVAGSFSFYPTKVITSGEGGMIVTADRQLKDDALAYRDQGKAAFGTNLHTKLGYAWRMSELHAATGVVHLRRLPEFLQTRRAIARRYTTGLAAIDGVAPLREDEAAASNYYKFVALLDDEIDRARLKAELRRRFDVTLAGEVYDTPLHLQPVFERFRRGALPAAERCCARHVCLPLHSDMTGTEADRVLSALATVISSP